MLKGLLQWLQSFLFPQKCLSCSTFISDANSLCIDCWKGLEFCTNQACDKCGIALPVDHYIDQKNIKLCDHCVLFVNDLGVDRVITACFYNDIAHNIITAFKYGDQTHTANFIAKTIITRLHQFKTTHSQDNILQRVIICPVPLHKSRLRWRKFNQSAMIAKLVARHFGDTQYIPDLLIRTRKTISQAGLNKTQRNTNLLAAFDVNPKYLTIVNNQSIILVDDIITTGSTIKHCSTALQRGNINNITAIAFARTLT